MGHILVRPIRTLPARHRDEHPVGAFDDLETPDHEGIVERHAGEGFELIIVPERYADFSYLECHNRLTRLEFRAPIPRSPKDLTDVSGLAPHCRRRGGR